MNPTQSKPNRHVLMTVAAVICILSNGYLIALVHQSTSHSSSSSSIAATFDPPPLTNDVARYIRVPDWHLAVDCSVWDSSCPSTKIMEGRYEAYPFPLSRHIKNLTAFDHKIISGVPDEWMHALNIDNSLENPPPRTISYSDVPRKVSTSEKEKCIKDSYKLDWKVQIDRLLRSLRREPTTNMIAYTISDYNYAFDMMHDVFAMNSDIVGFKDAFFMVALDKETLEMACDYSYPVVAWPSAKPDDLTELKHAVAFTKFEVSLYLIEKNIDFFFYEMDVW